MIPRSRSARNNAPATTGQGPHPTAPVRPVVDTYFGVWVTDPYRWMETPNSAELREWMLAQDRVTRTLLDAIPGRDSLRARDDTSD